MTKRWLPIVLGLAAAVAAFAWLHHINPPFLPTDDSIRDQLLARDCTDLGRCHLIGAPTSLHGFQQGAVWIDMLVAVQFLGGDPTKERTLVLALLSLAVGTVFVITWRWSRPWLAVPAAVAMTALLAYDDYPSLLINPSAAAFFDVLVAAGLLLYALSCERRFLLLAAFALGLAINTHIGSVSLLPALLLIAVLVRPRAWRELLLVAIVFSTVYILTSRAALRANVIGLSAYGGFVPAGLAIGGIVAVGAMAGARFRRLAAGSRAWIVGGVLVSPFGVAAAWLFLWQKHGFGGSYLHPIVAPAAVLGAALLALPFEVAARWRAVWRWFPTLVAIAATFVLVRPLPHGTALWRLPESRAVAKEATRRGWSYEELVFRIQSRECRELLSQIAIFAPPGAPTRAHGRRVLQVLKAKREAVTRTTESAAVLQINAKDVLLVREVDSWLRPTMSTACRLPTDGRAFVCQPANLGATRTLAPERFLFATRSFPEINGLDVLPPYVARYEIPIEPVAGEGRRIAIAEPQSGPCGWQITRVDRVQTDGQLPATAVRLHSDDGAAGVLVVERRFDAAACALSDFDRRYPPCMIEASPGDPLAAASGVE
ncbi:MAG: hypothetical protein HY270_09360 [Deltaproteobacteria bacterium]|nr:hypothetical protein [Deltaproteobacteria bacterium]